MQISPKQREMLAAYAEDGNPEDIYAYGESALAWCNRERVISALIRKGLIDNDQVITDAGLALLNGCANGQ